MLFRLANASAIFQTYINQALAELLNVFCIVYLDNILIFSQNENKHQKHVKQIMKRLQEFKLFVKLLKCIFSQISVRFLGFVIDTEGVRMELDRVKIVLNWLTSCSYHDIQVFIGFMNFYCQFIKNYSLLTASMTDLLKSSQKRRKTEFF